MEHFPQGNVPFKYRPKIQNFHFDLTEICSQYSKGLGPMSAYIKKIDNVEPYPLMPQNFKCDSFQRSSPFWAQIVNAGKGFFPAYSMLTVVPSGSSKNLMKHCNPFQLTKQMQTKFTKYVIYFFKLASISSFKIKASNNFLS